MMVMIALVKMAAMITTAMVRWIVFVILSGHGLSSIRNSPAPLGT